MRLSDVVSHIDLTIFPELGLGAFFVVFVAVTVRACRTNRSEHARNAAIPLESEPAWEGNRGTLPETEREGA